jgi:transcriptional regulator with XRE-family HTH domain
MSRRHSKQRPRQGARLAELRQAAGLSQAELARAIGVPQQNVGYWELSDKPPRSDVLPALARVLGVSVESLLSPSSPFDAARRPGPRGRLLKTFEAAASLPRSQQLLVEQFVSTLLAQRKAG